MPHHRDDEFNKKDVFILTLIFTFVGVAGTLVTIFILSGAFNLIKLLWAELAI